MFLLIMFHDLLFAGIVLVILCDIVFVWPMHAPFWGVFVWIVHSVFVFVWHGSALFLCLTCVLYTCVCLTWVCSVLCLFDLCVLWFYVCLTCMCCGFVFVWLVCAMVFCLTLLSVLSFVPACCCSQSVLCCPPPPPHRVQSCLLATCCYVVCGWVCLLYFEVCRVSFWVGRKNRQKEG